MLLNDVVLKNTEEFLGFKTFSDRLDSFYVGFLEKREELEVLRKFFKIIVCFWAVECEFNTDDLFTVKNQSTFSLDTMRMVHHEHMCV